MSAMFRIVQDDYPPLPEGISQALRDFLLLCFQKEPVMRSSAAQLLQHPWLKTSHPGLRGDIESTVTANAPSSNVDPRSSNTSAVNATPTQGVSGGSSREPIGAVQSKSSSAQEPRLANRSAQSDVLPSVAVAEAKSQVSNGVQKGVAPGAQTRARPARPTRTRHVASPSSLSSTANAESATSIVPTPHTVLRSSSAPIVSEENNGDRPPAPGAPVAKNAGILSATSAQVADASSPAQGPQRLGDLRIAIGGQPSSNTVEKSDRSEPRVDQDGDEDWDNEFSFDRSAEDEATIRISRPEVKPIVMSLPATSDPTPRVVPNAFAHSISSGFISGGSNRNSPSVARDGMDLTRSTSSTSISDIVRDTRLSKEKSSPRATVSNVTPRVLRPTLNRMNSKDVGGGTRGGAGTHHSRKSSDHMPANNVNLSKFQEDDEEDMEKDLDLAGFDALESAVMSAASKGASDSRGLALEFKSRMQFNTTGADEANEFDEFLSNQFEEKDFNENKEEQSSRCKKILNLMQGILPDTSEDAVIRNCDSLVELFTLHPEQKEYLIAQHGVLPVQDMLEARSGLALSPSVPILDMLEGNPGAARHHVLRVINKIMEGCIRAQEQLAVVGMIPLIIRLVENTPRPGIDRLNNTTPSADGYPVDPLMVEAARFVHQISLSNSLTLQMLVAAGGLPVLVHMVSFSDVLPRPHQTKSFLAPSPNSPPATLPRSSTPTSVVSSYSDPQNDDATIMVQMGIDCIIQLFAVQASRTRDLCRLFIKFGLLSYLPQAFHFFFSKYYSKQLGREGVSIDVELVEFPDHDTSPVDVDDSSELTYVLHIANIFFNFSRSSAAAAEKMSSDEVLSVVMEVISCKEIVDPTTSYFHLTSRGAGLSPVFVEVVELLLKSVKNLSMEPSVLDNLERSNIIPLLIKLLDGPLRERCRNHVLPSMFNLCRVNRKRQELAATCGLIPHLQQVIEDNSHLRQFALPIICELAHNTNYCRDELWKNNGVVFYINLLQEKYWQTFALNALAIW